MFIESGEVLEKMSIAVGGWVGQERTHFDLGTANQSVSMIERFEANMDVTHLFVRWLSSWSLKIKIRRGRNASISILSRLLAWFVFQEGAEWEGLGLASHVDNFSFIRSRFPRNPASEKNRCPFFTITGHEALVLKSLHQPFPWYFALIF
jgi:hypothetical protein